MLRAKVSEDLKEAMKARDSARVSTLRMINSAIKDRDIAARTGDVADRDEAVSDDEIITLLAKMIRQRQDSAKAFDDAGRSELADKERAEIAVIEGYLPRQLTEAEVEAAVEAAIAATGATSIRDMGKVMAELRARHSGQMDFGKVGASIKAVLK